MIGRSSDDGINLPASNPTPLAWDRFHQSVLPPASALLHTAFVISRGISVSLEANLGQVAATMFHDHRVQGRAVFPGAGYLELAVSGACILTGNVMIPQLITQEIDDLNL